MAGHGRQQFLPAQKFFRSHAGPRENENTEEPGLRLPGDSAAGVVAEKDSPKGCSVCANKFPPPVNIPMARQHTLLNFHRCILVHLRALFPKKFTCRKHRPEAERKHFSVLWCTFFPVFFIYITS